MSFKDRVPSKPNRKKITFEDDNTVRYATVEYADEPIEVGTPLNKSTFDSLRIVKGSYKGTGVQESQIVNLGFRPSFVLINNSSSYSIGDTGGSIYPFTALAIDGQVDEYITITDTGFAVTGRFNKLNERIHYTYIVGRGDL